MAEELAEGVIIIYSLGWK